MSNSLRFLRGCRGFCVAAALTALALPAAEGPATESARVAAAALPPLPPGVEALRFDEFFAPPGARGLVATERLKQLAGKRVRLLGYMVRRDRAPAGRLILAPLPVTLSDREYGQSDDLPPAVAFVEVPDAADRVLPFTPGLLMLTGTLALGPHEEPDGRVSHVRLTLDPAAAAAPAMQPHPFAVPAHPAAAAP